MTQLTDFSGPEKVARSNDFIKIVPGIPVTIQILDKKSHHIVVHWIADGTGRRFSFRCLGKDVCPVCIRNAEIGWDRKHPNYIPAQNRYRVNVLDLTQGKICPACGAVYVGNIPEVCTNEACSASLRDVEAAPLNRVRILERGRRLFQKFNALQEVPNPFANDEIIPIQSYPIRLVATGQGTQMEITVLPQPPNNIDPTQYELLDLDAGLVLTPEEIQFIMDGGSLNDVLSERRAAKANASSDEGDIPF